MDYKLEELIDISSIRKFQDKLFQLYGLSSALIDSDGKSYSNFGDHNICSKFKIVDSNSSLKCYKNYLQNTEQEYINEQLAVTTCLHNLISYLLPVIVDGNTLFKFEIGPLFQENPDISFYTNQARENGFDEKEYIEAINQIPVCSKEKFSCYMEFARSLVEMFAQSCSSKLKEIESRKLLEQKCNELEETKKQFNKALENLEFEKYLMNSLMDNALGSIYFKDLKSRFLKTSKYQIRKFGLENEEQMIGKTDLDFFTIEHAQKAFDDEQEIIRTGVPLRTEEKETWVNKEDTWVSTYKFPLKDKLGKIIGTCGISIDITDRKIAEQKLQVQIAEYEILNEELIQTNNELFKAKQKAEDSERLKTAFLQNLSHEIRTPMNAIMGFSAMLDLPDISEEKRQNFVTIIKNSSNQLLSIITDILTISSLETRQERINENKVCVNHLILDLLEIFKSRAAFKSILIIAKPGLNETESEIYSDGTKLTQILTNLLVNAMKFTSDGRIEFGYNLVKTQEHNALLQFYVKDSGIGIRPEQQKTIFEPFRQADLSINKNYGGAGLGLSISKGLVELLGGRIWVDSEVGKGSTFHFTIPYKPAQVTKTDQKIPSHHAHARILLVAEDDANNYYLIEEILDDMDIKLIHAKDGIETVELCKSNKEISLVLMDIKMPLLDGYSAAMILKEFRPDLPVIAQTAYALDIEKQRYKDVFDDYITKPIDGQELKQKVTKYMVM